MMCRRTARLLLLPVMGAFAISASAQGPSFSTQVIDATQDIVVSTIEHRDLDGDGREELVVAGYIPSPDCDTQDPVGVVRVYADHGRGDWQQERGYELGWGIDFIALGDFDGDGTVDVAAIEAIENDCSSSDPDRHRIFVEFGIDGGSALPGFVADIDADPTSSFGPRALSAADLDADGADELVLVTRGRRIRVFDVGADELLPIGAPITGSFADSIAIGQLVGGSEHDVVTISYSPHELRIYTGLGDGTFDPIPMVVTHSPTGPAMIADMDADGLLDIVCAGGRQLFMNEGGGSFTLRSSSLTYEYGGAFAITDLDADPYPDVILTRQFGGTSIYRPFALLNAGDASVPEDQLIALPGDAGRNFLAAVDVNGDGLADMVYGTRRTGIGATLRRSTPDPGNAFGPPGLDVPTGIVHVLAHDFDADGLDDFAACSGASGSLSVYYSDGQGGTRLATQFANPESLFRSVVLNLNGDGAADLAAVDQIRDRLVVFPAIPGGFFADRMLFSAGDESTDGIAAADLDADGFDEIVLASESAPGLLVIDNNSGVLDPDPTLVSSTGAPFQVELADLNADTLPDAIAVDRTNGQILVFLNDAEQGLAEFAAIPYGRTPYWLTLGDFNSDARPDAAVIDTDLGTLGIFLGDGAGGMTLTWERDVDADLLEIAAFDADRDGTLDLLVTAGGSQALPRTLHTFRGVGDGTFTPWARIPACQATGAAWCDYDGDGVTDIASATQGGNDEITLIRGLPAPCPADLDGSGTLNFDDIDAFVLAFLAGDLLADLDASGTLNFDDIDAFIAAFGAGCP